MDSRDSLFMVNRLSFDQIFGP